MCGIVGIVQQDGKQPPSETSLRRMLAAIRHRGPDQFGVYLDLHTGLGSARLSIIDLAGGQQPISNEDQSLWIVFNGEIFNYTELRSVLETRGHRFATHTDTEVIIHAYEEFGPDCLLRFNGQFSFAIWNRHKNELFLARDRLGVRPLFYCVSGGNLIFGSEIKAIFAEGTTKRELDPQALLQVFSYWCPLSPRTAFRGIYQLPPGSFLLAQNRNISIQRFWNLEFPNLGQLAAPPSTRDCVEEFRWLLTDAVRLRLRADVPVGAYLSGGLDSSTIAAIVRRLGVSRLDTFSISFSDPQFDESSFQQQMARFLGTEHKVVHATHADIGCAFPDVIWHTEVPVTRTSPAPMFLLSKLVRAHNYKVVLTGEGADEFLAGYDIFKEALIRQFWARQPGSRWRHSLLRRVYPDIAGLSATSEPFLKAFFGAGLETSGDPYFSHAVRWHNNLRTHRFFTQDFVNAAQPDGCGLTDKPRLPLAFENWHPLARAQYLEIEVFLSQYLLSSQGDRPAMANSVEGRFPFLDPRVVQFCNALPVRLKLRGLTEKVLLRHAAREWLPTEIWQRRKKPYRAPIHRSFFGNPPPEYVRDLLDPGAITQNGIFRPAAVEKLVSKIQRGNPLGETDDMALVGILSTQLVHHLFVKKFPCQCGLPDTDDVKLVDFRALAFAK